MKSKSSVSFAWMCYHILTNTKCKDNKRPGKNRKSGEGALRDCHSTTHNTEPGSGQEVMQAGTLAVRSSCSRGNHCLIYSWGIHTHTECSFKMALNFEMMAFSLLKISLCYYKLPCNSSSSILLNAALNAQWQHLLEREVFCYCYCNQWRLNSFFLDFPALLSAL